MPVHQALALDVAPTVIQHQAGGSKGDAFEVTDIQIAGSSEGANPVDGSAAPVGDDRVQTSATSVERKSAAEEATACVPSGSHRARGTVLWSESVRSDVACHLHQLEEAYRAERLPGSFLELAIEDFFDTWALSLGRSDVWEHVARNYRYRCTSPVCDSRNVTLHHIVYRAHGGDDDDENLTTPCDFCHLDGEHGGRLRILPPASRPTFLLGNPPVLVVQGRRVVAA